MSEQDIRFDQDEKWIEAIIEEFPILANPDDTKMDELTSNTKEEFYKRWPRIIKLMLEQHYKIKVS